MTIIHTIILGIVEGITEFLPISSTFHLIFTSKLLGLAQSDFAKLFEVFIQSGAILSVVILYFKTIWNDRELMKKVIVSFIPTAAIGFVLHKVIKEVFFETDVLMISVFIGMGLVFFLIEYLVKKQKVVLKKTVDTLDYKHAIIIGLVQALAVIPGVSRSGSVMVGMIAQGYTREESARYSFLLAIPTIFAASLYDLYEMKDVALANTNNLNLLLIGFVAAFASSYVIVKWFIQYLQKHSLVVFGWYRIVLGIIMLVMSL
jgi:undecaprenyl-diphosphatase